MDVTPEADAEAIVEPTQPMDVTPEAEAEAIVEPDAIDEFFGQYLAPLHDQQEVVPHFATDEPTERRTLTQAELAEYRGIIQQAGSDTELGLVLNEYISGPAGDDAEALVAKLSTLVTMGSCNVIDSIARGSNLGNRLLRMLTELDGANTRLLLE